MREVDVPTEHCRMLLSNQIIELEWHKVGWVKVIMVATYGRVFSFFLFYNAEVIAES